MTTMTTRAGPSREALSRSPGAMDGPAPRNGKHQESGPDGERMARGLGWFSIGLGLAEIVAPSAMARLIGIDERDNENRLQAFGVREMANGVGILSQPKSAAWLWTRVAGDVMDLAALGAAYNSPRARRDRVAVAALTVAGVTCLDILAARRLSQQPARRAAADGHDSRIHVVKVVTIGSSPREVYDFWRNLENLPQFMEHLESVQVLDGTRSRWKARAPAGSTIEWESEIVEDRPGELISWRSLPASEVLNSGQVWFTAAPGSRGTEVKVELRYDPPGGKLGVAIAKMFGEEPGQQIGSDLRRLKQVLETGEVVHSDASIHRGMHPAQPSAAGRGETR